MSDRFACADCNLEWVHSPAPAAHAAGTVVLGLAAASAVGMLWVIRGNDTLGAVLGLGSLVAMGIGVRLRGRGIPRCAECKRYAIAVDNEDSSPGS